MGARSSRIKYSDYDLNRLAKASGLTRSEIDRLHSDYVQAAGRDGVLSMDEFIRLYSQLLGAETQNNRPLKEQATQIFRTFDRDNTGRLSFDEFISAIVVMNQNVSQQERFDFLIRENNLIGREQGDGRISSKYGHQVFRRLNDFYGLPPGTEHKCWEQLDPHKRGYVTQEEFINFVMRNPNYNRK